MSSKLFHKILYTELNSLQSSDAYVRQETKLGFIYFTYAQEYIYFINKYIDIISGYSMGIHI